LEKAKQFINEGIRLFPQNQSFPKMLIYNDFLEGHFPAVIRVSDSLLHNNVKLNEAQMAQLSIAYYKTNRVQESNLTLHQLTELYPGKNESPDYCAAVIWASRNQPDSCFSRLEKAINKPEPLFRLFKIDPAFAALRKRPEYQKLYAAYGFDKY
jgi:hypothetical protein